MVKSERGIAERARAAAALAGREKGVPLGPEVEKLAESHSTEELRELAKSDAAKEAENRRRRKD